jgi:hypothetical protein
MIEDEDITWLFKNHARMDAFDQWRDKVHAMAATKLREEIARTAKAAISGIELNATEAFRAVEDYVDGADSGVFWTLDNLYEAKTESGTESGMWVEVWLPAKNVKWLSPSARDYAPVIGLYAYAGRSKSRKEQARRWVQEARKAVPSVKGAQPPSGEEEEDGYYCAFERKLFDELLAPENVEDRLTPILREFTRDILPALRAARKSVIGQLGTRTEARSKRR